MYIYIYIYIYIYMYIYIYPEALIQALFSIVGFPTKIQLVYSLLSSLSP